MSTRTRNRKQIAAVAAQDEWLRTAVRHAGAHRSRMLTVGVAGAVAVCLGAAAGAVRAQQAPPAEPGKAEALEEIVVTATKREAVVQDVPIAISALGGETLRQANVADFEDYARLTPSLQFTTQGVGDARIIIRGIQSGGGSTVGVYFDEAVITGANYSDDGGGRQPNIKLYDVERLEILKGPQGTLFGASSMSGTVRVITNKPRFNELESSGSFSGATVDDGSELYWGEAMVNIPVVQDRFALRAVGWFTEGGGFIEQAVAGGVEEDVNDESTLGGRLMARWQPTSAMMLTATALHQSAEMDGTQALDGTLALDSFSSTKATREPWDEEANLFSLVLDYALGAGSIVAATSYFDRDIFSPFDTTPTNNLFGLPGLAGAEQYQTRSIWSSELRFSSDFEGPFQLVAGLFFERDENTNEMTVVQADPVTAEVPCTRQRECVEAGFGTSLIFGRRVFVDLDQYAIFAQGDYAMTEQLTLTAGLRLFRSDQHNIEQTTQNFPPPTVGGPVQTEPEENLNLTAEEDEITYNLSLAWEPSEQTTYYARIATGFRPGGINDAAFASQFGISVPASFAPDSLTNYELGVKTQAFDRRLYTELALYTILWEDQQVPGVSLDGAFGFTANAGESRVNGAELELVARPTDRLSASLGVTFTDAKLTQDQPAPPLDDVPRGFDGDRIPKVPRWSFAGRAAYEFPVAGYAGYVRGSFSYQGESMSYFNDTDPTNTEIGDFWLVDAAAGVRIDNWDVSLFAKNLTNEAPLIDVFRNTDGFDAFTVRPRMIGLRIGAQF